jgi:tetratricopeptide (TPR) repeat protein
MRRLTRTFAIAPLVSDKPGQEESWLGLSLSKLLTDQLTAAGLPALRAEAVAQALLDLDKALPLDEEDAEAVMQHLGLSALVHGGFRTEGERGTLRLALSVEAADQDDQPLELDAPMASFPRFVERVALALIRKLGYPVDDKVRAKVAAASRPSTFASLRQLARARAAWAVGEHELALALVESALQTDPNLEEAAEIQVAVARAAGEADTAAEAYRRWADMAAEAGRPVAAADRLLDFGNWLLGHGSWEQAQAVYQEALALFEGQGHRLGVAQTKSNLAGLALQRGDWQAAVEAYQASIRAFGELGDEQDVAIATFNLSLAYKALGHTEDALDAINRALALSRALKDRGLEARCFNQRGAIQAGAGNWPGAEADCQQAARLHEAEGDLPGLATVKDHLATLYKEQGDFARAEALRLEAVALFEKIGNPHELAVTWTNLAMLYMEMGAYSQAWDYASRAHQVFTRLGSGLADLTARLLQDLR